MQKNKKKIIGNKRKYNVMALSLELFYIDSQSTTIAEYITVLNFLAL